MKFPKAIDAPAAAIIKGLMEKAPSKRLPMRAGGTGNINTSKWYIGFCWDALANGSMQSPYVLTVRDNRDTSNFRTKKEYAPPHVPYHSDGSGWDSDMAWNF